VSIHRATIEKSNPGDRGAWSITCHDIPGRNHAWADNFAQAQVKAQEAIALWLTLDSRQVELDVIVRR
jgi:hypothetical protein